MITDAELAAMKEIATDLAKGDRYGGTEDAENQLRLIREVEELRAALRGLVDAIKSATNVSYIEITQELDTATEKAHAALGDAP